MKYQNSSFYTSIISKLQSKHPKKFKFGNYDLTQVLYRQLIIKSRVKIRIKKKQRFLFLKEYIKYFLGFIFPITKIFITKKIDTIFVPNNIYQLTALDDFLKNSNERIGFIQDFKINIVNKKIDSYKIKKFLFLEKTKESEDEILNKFKLFEKIIKFYNPKKVYLIEGDATTDAIIGLICKKLSIKCFCLQHGFHGPILSQNYSKFFFKNFFSDFIYLIFSKETAKILRQKQLIRNYKVIGKKIKKKYFYEKKQKKIVFPIPSYVPIEGINFEVFKKIVRVINILSKKLNDYTFVIRLHPKGLKNKYIINSLHKLNNIEIHDANKINLRESFYKSSLTCLLFGSSIITDCLESGSIPIIMSTSRKFDYTYLTKKNIGFVVNNENQLIKKSLTLLNNCKILKNKRNHNYKFLKKYYAK